MCSRHRADLFVHRRRDGGGEVVAADVLDCRRRAYKRRRLTAIEDQEIVAHANP